MTPTTTDHPASDDTTLRILYALEQALPSWLHGEAREAALLALMRPRLRWLAQCVPTGLRVVPTKEKEAV